MRRLGFDMAQGFLLARPVPLATLFVDYQDLDEPDRLRA